MRRGLALFFFVAGCAAPPSMGCTSAVDGSGRGIPVCTAAQNVPVCDAPGAMAHFTGTATSSLVDGSLASCDSSNELVCADRTVMPRCAMLASAPMP